MPTITQLHRQIINGLIAALLAACSTAPTFRPENMAPIAEALQESMPPDTAAAPVAPPPEVAAALLPQMSTDIAGLVPDIEPRFDISVKATQAPEFFMSLVKGTHLNMVMHPEVSGKISISLRDVTLEEVLSTVRDVYGYRYRRQGNTYQVFPASMRTQVFTVNYLDVVRDSSSRTTVSSGQVGKSSGNGQGSTAPGSPATGAGKSSDVSGSVVRTDSESDFWLDLKDSLNLIVGKEDGRKVVVHPQSGVIVVHAMPEELRDVGDYLATIENAAHRLVILEAKIIEVTLNDRFQAGINWNALIEFGDDKSILFGHSGGGTVFDSGVSGLAGTVVPLVRGTQVTGFDTNAFGGIFTIDANLKDFNALIELLKTQGDVQVLSSPRISTVNNQKAVIKVGQDEYFVTDIETDTDITDGVSNQSVDVTLTPFFSGVALDVLPQIDADDNVILHIHPAISEVMEKTKNIKVSTTNDLSIPLALSTIRETDSVIRARSGQVVVLGGLMKNALRDEEARTPLLGDAPVIGNMFRHRREVATKSELVILLRPIVINNDQQWNGQLRSTADSFRNLRTLDSNGR
ncbi:MAG: pilus (MSHA type) biogenesis protein MshL [Gammaproteobacteria bacterium]